MCKSRFLPVRSTKERPRARSISIELGYTTRRAWREIALNATRVCEIELLGD